ncbi:MAG: ABC transporter ATP-binding protein [Phycisphaerales bacterium]|nr:ABC transporter ATP-binding protein [Planctomycetota bacterium]MBL6997239.1 ABC transporter ATP-binding protein [Phycisphaerales bacterium]
MAISNSNLETVVEAAGLTKIFRDFWMRTKASAVDGITFQIHKGELFGLLGPNGSGKSTTIKLILGLLNITKGRLSVFGREPHDVAVKRFIGFLPEESYLYPYLNCNETLDYYGRLYGITRKIRKRRAEELLDMVGLTQVAHRHVGEFSKGMMRRIGLAQALMNDPEFLILDEPTSGLDPIGTRQVKDLLIELKRRGKTILLSSHLLADVEDVCDRMTILYGGKIHAEGTVDELLVESDHTMIRIPRLHNDGTIEKIDQILQDTEGTAIESVTQPRQNLESFFIQIVDRAREAKVETSGVKGGTTAPFLRSDQKGDALIEKLIDTENMAEGSKVSKEEVVQEVISHKEVLDSLENEEVIEVRAKEANTEQRVSKEADSSVIDSLVEGQGNVEDDPQDTK